MFSTVAPDPSNYSAESSLTGGERSRVAMARPRHRLREEEYAALAVLDNWELLVSYAVKNGLVCLQDLHRRKRNTPNMKERQSLKPGAALRPNCSRQRTRP